jgi:Domain of unknown function (DUF4158)
VNAPEESNFSERWTLTPPDHALAVVKGRANRLSFAVLLLFFRERGRFPQGSSEVDPRMVGEVARQSHLPSPVDHVLNLSGRTAERHRAEIRALFGYREATVADAKALEEWLRDQAALVGAVPGHLVARFEARCREMSIEPPSGDRIDRIVKAAIRAHDDRLYSGIRNRLTLATRDRLEALLRPARGAEGGSDGDEVPEVALAPLLKLRSDPGRLILDTLVHTVNHLAPRSCGEYRSSERVEGALIDVVADQSDAEVVRWPIRNMDERSRESRGRITRLPLHQTGSVETDGAVPVLGGSTFSATSAPFTRLARCWS